MHPRHALVFFHEDLRTETSKQESWNGIYGPVIIFLTDRFPIVKLKLIITVCVTCDMVDRPEWIAIRIMLPGTDVPLMRFHSESRSLEWQADLPDRARSHLSFPLSNVPIAMAGQITVYMETEGRDDLIGQIGVVRMDVAGNPHRN